jgi:hypothetical protein
LLLADLEDLDLTTDLRLSVAWREQRDHDNKAWNRALIEIGNADREEVWVEISGYVQAIFERGAINEEVRNAAYDATTALLVRDRLSRVDFETLYKPWGTAVDNAHNWRPL